MASGTATIKSSTTKTRSGFLAGRRGRLLRESFTAYLFIFPAMSLIFIFGLFPVAFSLYVSMYKWKIKQGAFRGLANYTKAMDDLAYVVAFLLALGAIYIAISILVKILRTAGEESRYLWLFSIPGTIFAAGTYYFLKFVVLVLPEILAIGDKVRRVERTRELYVQLFREAFQVEAVAQARQYAFGLLALGLVLWLLLNYAFKHRHNSRYVGQFFQLTFSAWVGWLIGSFTYNYIQAQYAKAMESGKEITIWVQVMSIMGGLFLFYFSWKLWLYSQRQATSTPKMLTTAFASIGLLSGAWILIGEVPPVIAAGDKALWNGLLVTVWYSMGTVPIQLAVGLAVAYLLYQDIKAKSFFRMLYFIPYITPAVASASVFRIMFSNRPTGMMNNILAFFGQEPLKWLLEPNPIFKIFGLPGPSLALVVIILFGIWTYSGYNAVIFLAGLGSVPRSLYEAAQIDGANRWQSFRHVTLPLLSPITYFLSLLGVIGTFKAFNHIFVLRNPAALRSVDTLSMVIWDLIKTDNRYGYGTAVAFILFGVVLILTLINNSVQGKRVFYG